MADPPDHPDLVSKIIIQPLGFGQVLESSLLRRHQPKRIPFGSLPYWLILQASPRPIQTQWSPSVYRYRVPQPKLATWRWRTIEDLSAKQRIGNHPYCRKACVFRIRRIGTRGDCIQYIAMEFYRLAQKRKDTTDALFNQLLKVC